MELLGTLIWVNRTNEQTNERTNGRTDSLLELAEFYPAAKNPVFYFLIDYDFKNPVQRLIHSNSSKQG